MNLFQKLAVTSVATLSSWAAINTHPAQAATITQNFTTNSIGQEIDLFSGLYAGGFISAPVTDFSSTSSFAQFDPGLGTLTSVSLDVNQTGVIDQACFLSFSLCELSPSGTSSTLGANSSPLLSLSEVIETPRIFGNAVSTPFSSDLSETTENIASFLGSGSVPFQTDIYTPVLFFGYLSTSVSRTVDATLTYTYTPVQSVPEPSTNLGLDALALMGIGGLLLRKKVAP
jgi:hypothetical protein